MIDPYQITTRNRPLISEAIKDVIKDSFLTVPTDKTSAILGLYDMDSRMVRLHAAWKVNDIWKVGAQVGWAIGTRPIGYIGVEAAW